ncbi:MAG: hypothetical protein JWO87_2811 [Phycisphaerales bacterium]|jgi:hypothetical protein|nr:hypothetical protein [Phycisphaerales bacterium]
MLAALRVPLWAHAPASGEFLALQILGTTQILAGALLFPELMRDWRSAAMAIGTTWPMLLLAGFLASAGMVTIALVGIYVTAWLLVLAIWRLPLPSTRQQLTASAIAAGWAAAGPVLIYVHSEFPIPPLPPFSPTARAMTGPITGLFTILDPASSHEKGPWLAFAAALAVAAAVIAIQKRRQSRHRPLSVDSPNP